MANIITKVKVVLKGIGFPKFSGTSVYVQMGEHNILIDTGSFEYRGLLINNLSKLGLEPSDIDSVILTHMHIDHFSNLCIFENAKIYTTTEELKSYEKVVRIKHKFTEDEAINRVFNNSTWKVFNNSGLIEEQKKMIYQSIDPLSREQYKKLVFMDNMDFLFDSIELVRFKGHSANPRGFCFYYKGYCIVACGDAITNKRWFERVINHEKIPEGVYDEIYGNVEIASKRADIIIPGHGMPFGLTPNDVENSLLTFN